MCLTTDFVEPTWKLVIVKSERKVDDSNLIWLEATRLTIHKIQFHYETAEGTLNFNQSDETQLWRVTKNCCKLHRQETSGASWLTPINLPLKFARRKGREKFANAKLKLLERAGSSLSSAFGEHLRRTARVKVIWVLSCRVEAKLYQIFW